MVLPFFFFLTRRDWLFILEQLLPRKPKLSTVASSEAPQSFVAKDPVAEKPLSTSTLDAPKMCWGARRSCSEVQDDLQWLLVSDGPVQSIFGQVLCCSDLVDLVHPILTCSGQAGKDSTFAMIYSVSRICSQRWDKSLSLHFVKPQETIRCSLNNTDVVSNSVRQEVTVL